MDSRDAVESEILRYPSLRRVEYRFAELKPAQDFHFLMTCAGGRAGWIITCESGDAGFRVVLERE